MSKLTKTEASLVRKLMSDQGWDLIQKMLADRIRDIQADKVVGSNAFESLRMLHVNQGKADGLAEFFADLEKGALE